MPRPAFVVLNSGASLPVPDPADLLAGAAATRIVTTDASGDGALLTPTQAATLLRTLDPMTGGGWVSDTPASGTTMVWGSGKLTLTIPGGAAALGACGVVYANYLPDFAVVDFCARIDFVSGEADSDTRAYIALGNSITESVYLVMYGGGNYVVGATGIGAPWTQLVVASSGLSGGDRTGGQMWIRLHRSPTSVAAMMGVGSGGSMPAAWTTLYIVTNTGAIRVAQGRWVRLGLDSDSAPVGGAVVDVLDIRTSPAGAPL